MRLNLALVFMVAFLAGCEKGAPGNTAVDTEWKPASDASAAGPSVLGSSGTLEAAVEPIGNAESVSATVASEVAPSNTEAAGAINARIHQAAIAAVDNLNSSSGPGGGNLACAWAVNRILRGAVGRTFDHNGTSSMDAELRMGVSSGTVERIAREDVQPGDIIISPTEGNRIGHVGIMGENGLIYSNSSSSKQWKQNYNLATWDERYKSPSRNLQVNFYRVTTAANTEGV